MKNIKSMTGYGKASDSIELRRITVEIKSLNSKQLDLSARIPFIYREHEFQLRRKVGEAIARGKADLYVTIENLSTQVSTTINKSVFNEYLSQINALNCDMTNTDIVAAILKMPDVISTAKVELDKNEIEILNSVVDEAIKQLNCFRLIEGEVMMVDILMRLDTIEKLLKEADQFEAERIEIIKTRIIDNLEKVRVSLDPNRLEQEMIYYIEKLDVTEEKVRLKKHIDYFREVANNEQEVGKKLGFITQEIGREINTLGSKANNVNMQQIVVNMKDSLEKIKEQLLNIL